MIPTKKRLGKTSIRGTQLLTDAKSGQEILHVTDPHALVQAAGYLKHVCASDGESIFFRGQSALYPKLSPTLFRDSIHPSKQGFRIGLLNAALTSVKASTHIFSRFPEFAHEPLLQHYGFKTTWMDLVDNVWVALWFSCFRARSGGTFGKYLHFERRDPLKEIDGYAYIFLIAADSTAADAGFYVGNSTELIDLRVAAPSIFVRPHAQHGVLFRLRGRGGSFRPTDYSSQVRGIVRIGLADALSWLGDGNMLGVHALFPPPYYDLGYEMLLNANYTPSDKVGCIAHIGA